ncbi:MAG: ribonuclease P protein component, partial [Alphaproteobacteria bacterium]
MQPARLKKHRQFVDVANKGQKLVSSGLILLYMPNETGEVRVGFTVTKKLGNAVVRNRIRRRLREVVRLGLAT